MKKLSKLQQDILALAKKNGGTLTYKDAYARFIRCKRPPTYYQISGNDPPADDYFFLQRAFDRRAECIRHSMHRLIRRGLAVFEYSEARQLHSVARSLKPYFPPGDSKAHYFPARRTKPIGIDIRSHGNRTLKAPAVKRNKRLLTG